MTETRSMTAAAARAGQRRMEALGGNGMTTALHFDQALYDAAVAHLEAGFSLIPVSPVTKRPVAALLPLDPTTGRRPWSRPRPRQPTVDELRSWPENGARLALVCGYHGLQVLDFDEPRLYPAWRHLVGSLAEGLPVQQTPHGGVHVLLRCAEPGTRQIPAYVADATRPEGRRIGIEIRGSGHTAKLYDLALDLRAVPELSAAHAEALAIAARRLDEAPYTRQQRASMQQALTAASQHKLALNGQGHVIDDYNQAVDIHVALEQYGYRSRSGNHYLHPGSTRTDPNVSVCGQKSFHWSPNDPLFCNGKGHDAFDLFCFFEHGNDPKVAAKAAAALLGLPPLTHTGAPPHADRPHDDATPVVTPLWRSLTDLLATPFPEPTWIIPELLSAGVTLCVGRPKRARKSWLLLQLALAVAGEGQVLGGLEVAHGDVLYLGLEDTDRRLQRRGGELLTWGRGAPN